MALIRRIVTAVSVGDRTFELILEDDDYSQAIWFEKGIMFTVASSIESSMAKELERLRQRVVYLECQSNDVRDCFDCENKQCPMFWGIEPPAESALDRLARESEEQNG